MKACINPDCDSFLFSKFDFGNISDKVCPNCGAPIYDAYDNKVKDYVEKCTGVKV